MTVFGSLLSTFANLNRKNILELLNVTSSTMTDLAKKLEISNSEVSRHLSMLSEHGFVIKNARDNKYSISAFGRLSLTVVKPLDFIFSHKQFFENHILTTLEEDFVKTLDSLSDSELIEGTGKVMMNIKQAFDETKERALIMTDQMLPFGKEEISCKYLVIPEMVKYSENVPQTVEIEGAAYLNDLPLGLLILDNKKALVFFKNLNNEMDYNCCFIVEDERGLRWINKVWEFYWKKAKKVL